ncbi:MAG: hypothetical protein C5B54_04065 [Acidobacteria bacterium]|nr:MAG: hypothetical protein C5B54_04065 [Acidobacteriota bacterium]
MVNGFALIAAVLLLVNGCKSENDQQGITGRYVGTQQFGIGQVTSAFALVITQKGNVISGTVTPPFSGDLVQITNGQINGTTVRFDRKVGSVTYHYEATFQAQDAMQKSKISGGLSPLGCLNPGSGEPCLSDSSGSFTATKQ